MARVVLHIGTHKTATTTLQDMFAHNAPLLAQHGLIYPRLGRMAGHHGLVMDWNRLPPIYALPEGSLASLRQIARDHAGGSGTVFLSSEEFSRGAEEGRVDFGAVREALKAFDRVEVVCVLREQWQFIQSIYLEVSKHRIPQRPLQFVEAATGTNMVEGLWTDYNLLLDHLLQSFAPDEITFLDYAALLRSPGGIIGGWLAHLGIGLDPAALDLVNGGRSNASPNPLAAWAANVVAEPQLPPGWLVEAATGAFKVQFGATAQGRLWTREEYQTLHDYGLACNSRLAARLTDRQPGWTMTATDAAGDAIHREDLRADFWLRCNRWMFASIPRPAQA